MSLRFRASAALGFSALATKLLSLFLCSLLVVPMAGGFKPKWHRAITWQAFDDINLKIGDTRLFFTREAIEEIVSSNVATDGLTSWGLPNLHFFSSHADSSWHFDAENFDAASRRLLQLKEAIVKELLRTDSYPGTRARQLLGSALHAIQDFYSHSNRAELEEGKVLCTNN